MEALDAIQMEGVFNTIIPEIQHALLREHYKLPTPVQSEAIPPQVAGDDLFGSAQTGTGKTAAFTIHCYRNWPAIESARTAVALGH